MKSQEQQTEILKTEHFLHTNQKGYHQELEILSQKLRIPQLLLVLLRQILLEFLCLNLMHRQFQQDQMKSQI
jgi:hypothetical protein